MAGIISEVRAKFSASAQGLMNSVREIRQDMQGLGDETQDSLRGANQAAEGLQDALEGVTTEPLRREFVSTGEAARGMGRHISDEMISAERMAGMAERGFSKLRKTFLTWTAAAAGVAVIGTGMGALVTVANDYQTALNHVAAQTNATEGETKNLGQSMQDIYAAGYGADFMDIAQSMGEVERATGLVGTALENTTKNAISLRDTFGYEVVESSKVASTMMKQFGISADEAYELMAQGAQEGLDKSGDMMDSFNEYSVYFKQLGFDAEGMWNVFKAGSESGAFNADKVGDAIKELGIRVKDGSKTTADGFAALGLNADEMAQKFAKGGKSSQEALQQVFKGLAEIEDPVKRNTAGVALFGTQFEDLEYETIAAMGTVRNEADMTGDRMERINEVKFDSIGAAITGIGRTLLVGLINPIQEKVMPIVNDMVNAFRNNMPQIQSAVMGVFNAITSAIAAFAPSFMNVFTTLKNIAPAILTPLGIAFQGITTFIAPVANAITGLIAKFTGMKAFAPILGGIITAFATYQIGLKIAMAAQTAWAVLTRGHIILMNAFRAATLLLNSAFLANPFVLIVALLAGLGVALTMAYQKSETFRNIVNKAWAGIKTAAQAVFNWFTVTVPAWVQSLIQWFNQLWTQSKAKAAEWKTALMNVWNNVKTAVSDFANATKAKFQEWQTALSNIWTNVKTAVSNFVTAIKNFFVNLYTSVSATIASWVASVVAKFNQMKSTAGGVISSFVSTIKTYFTNLVNTVKYIIEPFVNFFIKTWENLKLMVLGIVGVLTSMLVGDFEGMKLGVLAIWTGLKRQVQNIAETLKEVVLRVFKVLKSGITNIWNAIKSGAVSAWNGLKSAVVNAANAIKSGAINAWNALKSGVINAANALKNGAVSAWNSLKSSISSAVSSIKSGAINGFNALKSGAVNAVNSLKSGAVNAFNSLKSSVTSAVSSIKSGVVNGFNSAKSAAVNAWNGMKSAVSSAVSNIKSSVSNMKSNILSTIRGINLRSIGSDIMRGLLNGITSGATAVWNKAKEIANGIKNKIKGALDINSPSRVMEGFGINVGEGLANGIDSMKKGVAKVAGGMASAVTDNMDMSGALGGVLGSSASIDSTMTLKHVIDLMNVPSNMDENSLRKALMNVLGDQRVQRKIDRVNAENSMNFNRPLGAV
jgi:phage-related minor tail protein